MNRKATAFTLVLTLAGSLFMGACTSTKQSSRDATQLWFYGAPLYEVYLRAFSQEGTFNALTARLDELKAEGISTLWLMPIHPIGKLGRKGGAGSPYSVRDYYDVGSEYGTKEDFANLIYEAHARGMRIILDVVLNHSANDYPLMSEHPDWWMRDTTGAFSREVADWSDVTDWNYDNPETRKYLSGALEFWVRDFNVDGFRCDVAGMVPNDFWKPTIMKLHKLKPDLFMLAEWEDTTVFRAGFDAGYDWTLYHRMRELKDGKISVDSLKRVILRQQKKLTPGKEMMRFVENHDQQRSAQLFGWPGVEPYAALVFTLPGIPLIYSGQEIGEIHKPSLFEPEPIDWNAGNPNVNQFYRNLLALRNGNAALRTGDLEFLKAKTPDVLLFLRQTPKQHLLVAINFSDDDQTVTLPRKQARKIWSEVGSNAPALEDSTLILPAHGYRVFNEEK